MNRPPDPAVWTRRVRERVSGEIKTFRREANFDRTKGVGLNSRLTLFATITILLVVLAAAFFGGLPSLDWKELWQTATSPEKLQVFFGGFGLWAPIVFTLIQAAQVVISFIPAGPIMLAGVAALGPWTGFALSLFGAVAGSVAAFLIGRRLGRPAVERMVGRKPLERYAGKMPPDGLWILVALMVPLPAGGDVVCAVAGLSKISLRRFIIIVSLGRTPYTALAVLMASGLTTGSPWLLGGAVVALSLLVLAALLYARRVKRRAKNAATRERYGRLRVHEKTIAANLAVLRRNLTRSQDQLLDRRILSGVTGLAHGPPVNALKHL